VRQALADAGVDPKTIDQVVLVGGMTRMPRPSSGALTICSARRTRWPICCARPQPRQGAGQASAGRSASDVAEGEMIDAEPVETHGEK
jgi:hypothetical protein